MSLFKPTGMAALDLAQRTLEFMHMAAIEFNNKLAGVASDIRHIRNRIDALEQIANGDRMAQLQNDILALMEKQMHIIKEMEKK